MVTYVNAVDYKRLSTPEGVLSPVLDVCEEPSAACFNRTYVCEVNLHLFSYTIGDFRLYNFVLL